MDEMGMVNNNAIVAAKRKHMDLYTEAKPQELILIAVICKLTAGLN
jgi:hypothetical protein